MKIALLYFGQPRFVNNPHCFETQKNKIMSQGECDVFAHMWEPTDKGYDFSTWSGLRNQPARQSDIDDFISKWSPKVIKTEQNPSFNDEDLFMKIHERLPGGDARQYNFNLCLSQLYSIEKCIELFEEYVAETNTQYDFVILLRTDLCVWDFPDITSLEKGYFYFSSIFHYDHFADLCYITDPKYISGLKCYSYVTDKSSDFTERIALGNAEGIKRITFIKKWGETVLKQIPLLVRIVRDISDIGQKW